MPEVDVTQAPVAPMLERPTFARDIGGALNKARRSRGLRLRHLADGRLDKSALRAAERGELPLTRPVLTELASRYCIDLGSLFPARASIEIGHHWLAINGIVEPCDPGSLTSVLQAYLRLIGQMRGTGESMPRPVRRDDIVSLAAHLDLPCTTVISRLGDLLEARGAETRAMIDLYLTGASVVGLREAVAG